MEKQVYKVTIYESGRQEWRQNGKLHRLDGPAVIDGDYQAWYKDDLYHRIDGPAYINGDLQAWWIEGKPHRIDGPAYINGNHQEWWIEGKAYIKGQFDQKIKEMNQNETYLIFEGKKYQLVED